ncbi:MULTISPECIES: hypothetical protein [Sphingobacterium]|uniref:Uncharacterized protein n=1 Tax=Sphingobacterium nematocida TaxID=1513896 RepID=A0A1T5BJF4_9SPHI|nr:MULTISPECIES: hypothetical protein [Sphingobacterium]SKB47376.1 hypothetical protein SAMN05660841_00741 [Sphingobacterium nematocida]
MNFKIGDLVRFVEEPIEGHITSIQANDIIGVTDTTGFEIPVLKSKVTLVHGNMRMPEDDIEDGEASINLPFVDKGIFVGIAGEQKLGLAKFYIINETSFELLVSISELSGTKVTGVFGNLIPKQDYAQFYIANFSAVGKWPTFNIQIITHSKIAHVQRQPLSKEFRVKPLELINSKERVEMLNDKVWLYELDKKEEDIGLDKLKSHFISHRPKGR